MKQVERCVNALFEEQRLRHMAMRVGTSDGVLLDYYRSADETVNAATRFDMASVSKILSVTQLTLIAWERGLLDIEDPVSRYFPHDGELKLRHLLTHTLGMGGQNLRQSGVTNDTVASYILSLTADFPLDGEVRYSCPGFILMGKIVEQVFGAPLDELFAAYVTEPLGMTRTAYRPTDTVNMVNANLPEAEKGLVNDNNCRFLGGVAGNAGVFSCVEDLTRFCGMLLRNGEPLYRKDTFLQAIKNYTPGKAEARGLGFVYVDERFPQTGELFSVGSVGHCGHTGQFVFVDPNADRYAIILTDATRCHDITFDDDRYDLVMQMRADLCNAAKHDLAL